MLETGLERCRLCLAPKTKSGNFVDVFSTEGTRLMLWHKINNHMNVVVKATDAYSKVVCLLCVAKLDFVNQFKEVCIQSQYQLRQETIWNHTRGVILPKIDNPVFEQFNSHDSKHYKKEEFSNEPLETTGQSADEDDGHCSEEISMFTDSDNNECAEDCLIAEETITSDLQQLYSEAESHTSSDVYEIDKADKSVENVIAREAIRSNVSEHHHKAESDASIAHSSAISNGIKEGKSAETVPITSKVITDVSETGHASTINSSAIRDVITERKSAETILIAREAINSDVAEQNCYVESHASNANAPAEYKIYKGVHTVENTSTARGPVKSDVQVKCSRTPNYADNTDYTFQEIVSMVISKCFIDVDHDLQEQVEDNRDDCTTIQETTETKSRNKSLTADLQDQNTGNPSADTNCLVKETEITCPRNCSIEETSRSASAECVKEVATGQKCAVNSTLVCIGEVNENLNCKLLNLLEESDNCIAVGQSVDRDVTAAKQQTNVGTTSVNGVDHSVDPTERNVKRIFENSNNAVNDDTTTVLVKKTVNSVLKGINSPMGATDIMELFKDISNNSENMNADTTPRRVERLDEMESKKYKCEYCNEEFSRRIQKELHLVPAVNMNRGSAKVPCYLCDKPFPSLCAANYHIAKDHGRKTVYRCETCQKTFLEFGDCEMHKFRVHKQRLTKCSKCSFHATSTTEVQIHDRTYHQRISNNFSCPNDLCLKTFKNNSDLVVHARNVHTDCYQCVECGKSMKSADRYFIHMCKHNNIVLYECPNCDMGFMIRDELRSHFRSSHKDSAEEIGFTCAECEQKFTSRYMLVDHIRLKHRSQQSNVYDCYYCSKRFYKRNAILKHIRFICQLSPVEKPKWKCVPCNKLFKSKDGFKVHMVRHTQGKQKNKAPLARTTCEICGTTVVKYFIAEHMAKHSGLRNELCNICGKSFLQKSSLVMHMFSHGEKKFICDYCGKRFSRKDNMKKHCSSCTALKRK